MTDQECKETMMWLRRLAGGIGAGEAKYHARHTLEMLAEPRLPAEPTPEIIKVVWDAWRGSELVDPARMNAAERLYRALRAQLTKPATKTVWSVVSPHATSGGFDCRHAALMWASAKVPDTEPFSLTCAEEPA